MIKNAATVRFARAGKNSFARTLKIRVRDYFSQQEISNKANANMVLKTVVMLGLYILPFLAILIFHTGILATLGCFVLMGLGMSGVGMNVMHDAIHGAYHSNRTVNNILGATIYLISGNAATWRIQHNVLHHTFTNIEGIDEDMETAGLIRLHPSQKWKRMHRYQKFYTPFVYGLLTLNWVISKDFKQLINYYKRGIGGHTPKSIQKEWVILVFTKLLYFGLFIVLPLVFASVAWYWIILGFVLMHFTAGLVLSFIFQLAHMVEGVENMEAPADGAMEDEWMEHQLKTTANFARNNKLVSWFLGGLNFQVEHHLFPNICHIHYPAISKIVQETARDFGLTYKEYPKMMQAVKAHMHHLTLMGKNPSLAV